MTTLLSFWPRTCLRTCLIPMLLPGISGWESTKFSGKESIPMENELLTKVQVKVSYRWHITYHFYVLSFRNFEFKQFFLTSYNSDEP